MLPIGEATMRLIGLLLVCVCGVMFVATTAKAAAKAASTTGVATTPPPICSIQPTQPKKAAVVAAAAGGGDAAAKKLNAALATESARAFKTANDAYKVQHDKLLLQLKAPDSALKEFLKTRPDFVKNRPEVLTLKPDARDAWAAEHVDELSDMKPVKQAVTDKREALRPTIASFCGVEYSVCEKAFTTKALDGTLFAAPEASALTGAASSGLGFAAVSLTGTSWQTAALSGLAQFMAQRANDEVALWLEQEIAGKLCSTEAKAYFPQTCAVADPANTGTASFGALLAAALRHDLEDLPIEVLANYVTLGDPSKQALESVMDQLVQGTSPIALLGGMGASSCLQDACAQGDKSACWLAGIGTIVRYSGDVVEAKTQAEAQTAIDKLVKGVIYDACTADHSKVCDVIKSLDAATLSDLLTRVYTLFDTIEQWRKTPPSDTSTTLARAGELLRQTEGIIDDGVVLFKPPFANDWAMIKPLFAATADALKGQYADAVREVITFVNQPVVQAKLKVLIPAPVLQCISLAVDIALAKDATEVQNVLSSAAAPVGSWRLKRQNGFTIAVTSLVGVAGGVELPFGGATGYTYSDALFSGGLMGALGVDFIWRIGDKSNGAWTIGFYAPILDLGQLLSAPVFGTGSSASLSTSTTKATPNTDVTIAQVLSPGAYFCIGMGNTPFVFGVGAVVVPELRRFEHTQNAGSDQLSVVRIQAFVSVDLTLLPLFSHH